MGPDAKRFWESLLYAMSQRRKVGKPRFHYILDTLNQWTSVQSICAREFGREGRREEDCPIQLPWHCLLLPPAKASDEISPCLKLAATAQLRMIRHARELYHGNYIRNKFTVWKRSKFTRNHPTNCEQQHSKEICSRGEERICFLAQALAGSLL